MVEITKETWERNSVELIIFNGKDKTYKIVEKNSLVEDFWKKALQNQ